MPKRSYRLREGEQVPTSLTTIAKVMASPYFALGVVDARAKRGYRADYDAWSDANHQWNYEPWATLAPKSVVLKRGGKVTPEAIRLYVKNNAEIL